MCRIILFKEYYFRVVIMNKSLSVQKNSSLSAGEIIIGSLFVLLDVFLIFFSKIGSRLFDFTWVDFSGQWKICAYTVRGIDPYTQIGTSAPAVEAIGAVPDTWRASPWGCLLGNIFYPGYLSYNHAQIYFRILCAAVFIISLIVILKALKINNVKDCVFYILVFCSFFYFYSVVFGNSGGMCCCIMIVACIICEKHPYIAGILTGVAMIKPQLVLIICLALLLMKKIKTLFVAAGIDIAALLAMSVIIKKNPVDFTLEFFDTNIGEQTMPGGILSFLSNAFGVKSSYTLILSMLFGTIITFVAVIVMKKYKYEKVFPEWFICFVPFLVSSFWSYRWRYDDFIIIFACICCVYILTNIYSKTIKAVYLISLFYLFFKYLIIDYVINIIVGFIWRISPTVSDFIFRVVGIDTVYDFGTVIIIVAMTLAVISECKKIKTVQTREREAF